MPRNRRPPTPRRTNEHGVPATNEHGVPVGADARESQGARQYDHPTDSRPAVTTPAQEAAVLDAATDRFASLKVAGEACGYSADTMQRVVQRLKRRGKPVFDELVRIKDDQMAALIEDKMSAHLDYMTDALMAEANIGVLVKNFGILFDKLQLLQGRPTQIISVHERENMGVLAGLIRKEMERRGIPADAVDVTPESVIVEEG